jgi:hypothetical protein
VVGLEPPIDGPDEVGATTLEGPPALAQGSTGSNWSGDTHACGPRTDELAATDRASLRPARGGGR